MAQHVPTTAQRRANMGATYSQHAPHKAQHRTYGCIYWNLELCIANTPVRVVVVAKRPEYIRDIAHITCNNACMFHAIHTLPAWHNTIYLNFIEFWQTLQILNTFQIGIEVCWNRMLSALLMLSPSISMLLACTSFCQWIQVFTLQESLQALRTERTVLYGIMMLISDHQSKRFTIPSSTFLYLIFTLQKSDKND